MSKHFVLEFFDTIFFILFYFNFFILFIAIFTFKNEKESFWIFTHARISCFNLFELCSLKLFFFIALGDTNFEKLLSLFDLNCLVFFVILLPFHTSLFKHSILKFSVFTFSTFLSFWGIKKFFSAFFYFMFILLIGFF